MTSRAISCPHCRKETAWNDNPHRPFCSDRCRLIDLGNWADESYRVTTPPDNIIPFPQANPEEEL